MNEIRCPNCRGKDVIKKGKRETRFGLRQVFYCKNCKRKFTLRKISDKAYSPKVIINSINYYNLGHTFEKSAKLVNQRFKVKVTKSSVHRWVEEFKKICLYHKMREEVLKEYGKDILVSKTFKHNGLAYNFKFHKPKLEMLCGENGFSKLSEYVKGFDSGCPEFFEKIEKRCSKLKLSLKVKKESRRNLACKLASLALKACERNKERHSIVENFMLINDNATVASEVPVWLWEKNLGFGISGHIDLIQVRNNKIYILDFKPGAEKEKEEKVASQLYLYASGLSFRTGISLDRFICAWFDDSIYYEFSPAEADVRFSQSRWRSGK